MRTWRVIAAALLGLSLGCAGSGAGTSAAQRQEQRTAARIAFYRAKLARDPDLYPALAALGDAYLERARASHDPQWLARARAALERSLALQPTEYAYRTLAKLCAFSHRFEEGLRWAQESLRNSPPGDPTLLPLLVELNLGAGHEEAAAALLTQPWDPRAPQFQSVARAQWLGARKEYGAARQAFLQAASAAEAAQPSDFARWARVMAAGALIDSKQQLATAREELAAAALGAPLPAWLERVYRVHLAELAQAEGRAEESLAQYESLLREGDDVELARRAFVLARGLGQTGRAQRLFAAAERSAERIAAAGEIFSLEAQARLYADAGVQRERARALARRNLEFKHDRAARELEAYVNQAYGGSAGG